MAAAPPVRFVRRVLVAPFQQFVETGSLGGIVLLGCTALALAWANSPWGEAYFALWELKLAIGPAAAPLALTLHHWINDGLMAVFFLLVGLEIKRELLVGELASPRQAALPIVAAIGGMLVPAGLFAAFNAGGEGAAGWGIPMATDIAFALGICTLLGPRVPVGLKVFLAAFAIVDDLGAVLVIALFYSSALDAGALLGAAVALGVLVGLNRLHVVKLPPYLLAGLALWYFLLQSGIHATIAGVVLALTIPARTRMNTEEFSGRARGLLDEFDRAETGDLLVITSPGQREALYALAVAAADVNAPLLRLEHRLHSLVAFLVMPLFAFSNAGVRLGGAVDALAQPVVWGIVAGLVLGKVLGISAFSWLAVRLGLAALPAGASFRALAGVACLGGIGFTMSLFIAGLAFPEAELLARSKIGILIGSTVSATLGVMVLRRTRTPAVARLALLAVALAVAAAQPTPAADPAAVEAPAQPEPASPKPFAMARVAREAEDAHSRLQSIAARLAPSADERTILAALDGKQEEIDRLRELFDASQPELLPPRALQDVGKSWLRQAALLDGWQAALERRAGTIEEDQSDVRAMGELWTATAVAAGASGAPAPVQDRIATVSAAIEETLARCRARFDEILLLQDRVARLHGVVAGVLATHARALVTVQRTLFQVEAVPLWAAFGTARKPATVAGEIVESWRSTVADLRDFLRNAQGRLVLHLASFVALAAGLAALRRRGAQWLATADPEARTAGHVLSRPFAAAALIALLLTIWIYVAPPASLAHVVGILVLVPFFRLVPVLAPQPLHGPLHGLAALWIIERFRDLAAPHTLLARLLLLAVGVLGVALAASTLRPGGPAAGFPRARGFKAALGVTAGGLLAIAIVSNVLGNATLADVLTTGTLASVFAAVLLFAAARIVGAILAVTLRDRAAAWTSRSRVLVRTATLAVWAYLTLEWFRIWDPTVRVVSALLDEKLAFGAISISVRNVVAFAVALAVAIAAAKLTRLLLDDAVLPGLALPRGVPAAISKTVQYTILGVGIVLAMMAGGLDMGRFGFLAGALGVGIGFGLQNVVNNFVSGIILLYERPIQEGDVIEAGKVTGLVRRIGIRSSTVRTFEGAEVVVPNASLISAEVVNWTLSDRMCRAELKLGVAYGTDPRRVLEILRAVVKDRPGVLPYPAPLALFSGLGDSSLDFSLRFWIPDYSVILETRSAVLADVHAALGEAGIEIPFPQRDLHLRSVDPGAARALAGGDSA